MKNIFCIIALFFCLNNVVGQKIKPSINIIKAKSTIKLDGILDEQDWSNAEIASEFFQNFPADTSYAETKTSVKLTYDDNFLYIGAICLDELGGNYVIQSLKRDFSYPVSDAFAVFIDPFNDQTNGFSFAVNPLGVQREGLIEQGGVFGVTTSWDNRWYSKVAQINNGFSVEMAIPFKTIRYNSEIKTWGINFSRNDLQRNENSSWVPVPRNFNIASMAFTGNLIWDNPPKKAGTNISIIPYAIAGASKNYQSNVNQSTVNAGGDAKVAVTSSLNLDLTVNPDFSQVEVDDQPVNLTRFSIQLPEKRQFFIENNDLFARFGFSQIRPFFSRKIGIYNGQHVPILYGARLSGKVNENWRIGLMNMQTGNKDLLIGSDTVSVSAQNYTVAAAQRKLFRRSNVAAIFVNRQQIDNNGIDHSDYNRIIGLDYNLASADNKWQGKLFHHQAIAPGKEINYEASANASWLMYSTQNLFVMWNHEYVGKDYIADVGFVRRNRQYNPEAGAYEFNSYYRLEPKIEYKFYPKRGPINFHGPSIYWDYYADYQFKTTDNFIMPHYKFTFRNTSSFEIHYHEWFTRLLYDTDVTFTGSNSRLPAGRYNYRGGVLKYQSDRRKILNGNINLAYNSYYTGTRFSTSGNINYRVQPWGIFSMTFSHNRISIPQPYSKALITRIGPKVELSFTKSLFLSTLIQYNTQINNLNVNARLQWRFKPMSDLYVVYTDNYDPNLAIKNRALVVKFIYWLSI